MALTAGCAGNNADRSGQSTPSTEQSDSAPTSPAPGSTQSDSAPTSPTPGNSKVLTGTVGQVEDPDAFVITLKDSSGAEVSTLPAGDYQMRITDLSKIHNFRLRGSGVDEATTVPGTETVTWTVSLEPGEYTFLCEPHPQQMVGSLTVT
jgi:hypothetical protein